MFCTALLQRTALRPYPSNGPGRILGRETESRIFKLCGATYVEKENAIMNHGRHLVQKRETNQEKATNIC